MPARPLDEAGQYVAAADITFAVLLMVYVGIMAARLTRIQREIAELASRAGTKADRGGEPEERPRSVGERIAP